MKNNLPKLLIIGIFLIFSSACTKNFPIVTTEPEGENASLEILELDIPEGFNFETVLDAFDILRADVVIASVAYQRNGQLTRRVSYDRYRSQDFLKGVPFYHMGTFIKKQLAQKYSFDERYSTCADYKYFLEIFSEKRDVEIVNGDIVTEEGGASGGWHIRIVALMNMVNILGIGRLIRHPFHFVIRYFYKIKSLK